MDLFKVNLMEFASLFQVRFFVTWAKFIFGPEYCQIGIIGKPKLEKPHSA